MTGRALDCGGDVGQRARLNLKATPFASRGRSATLRGDHQSGACGGRAADLRSRRARANGSTPCEAAVSPRWALDDQVVILDLETSLYLTVTGAGAVVWPLLMGGVTLDAMVDAVLEVYDVDPSLARADLEAFLADLGERKLLR